MGNRLTCLAVIAFYLDRLLQQGGLYIQKLSNVNYISSIYKGKAIYSGINKGSSVNSISILRFLAIQESMGMKQQISQQKRAFLEENYNLLIPPQPIQGEQQEKRYQNSRKTAGSKIRIKENTILGSVKEVIPFLLKPLRINILKGYNQLSSS